MKSWREKLLLVLLILRSDVCAVIAVIKNSRTVAHNMDMEEVKQSAKHLLDTLEDTLDGMIQQQEENVKETVKIVNKK